MPHLKTHVSKTKRTFHPKPAACAPSLSLTSFAPSFLSPHLKFQTYLFIHSTCIECLLHALNEKVPFPYQALLCNFSQIHSHLTPSLSQLSNAFSHTGHFFSSGITMSFLPQRCSFCLDLPPSACYPQLHHQPLILNSSSHRSQPKRTSLEVFPDYPSSEVS